MTTQAPLLSELYARGNVNMYLSLITDLLMLLLIYLSANLLYNLTKIMIHNRMDDYRAMMQMGSRKTTIVLMIYFQILQYAVFATIAGIVLCFVSPLTGTQM